jgi:hypothetical protein
MTDTDTSSAPVGRLAAQRLTGPGVIDRTRGPMLRALTPFQSVTMSNGLVDRLQQRAALSERASGGSMTWAAPARLGWASSPMSGRVARSPASVERSPESMSARAASTSGTRASNSSSLVSERSGSSFSSPTAMSDPAPARSISQMSHTSTSHGVTPRNASSTLMLARASDTPLGVSAARRTTREGRDPVSRVEHGALPVGATVGRESPASDGLLSSAGAVEVFAPARAGAGAPSSNATGGRAPGASMIFRTADVSRQSDRASPAAVPALSETRAPDRAPSFDLAARESLDTHVSHTVARVADIGELPLAASRSTESANTPRVIAHVARTQNTMPEGSVPLHTTRTSQVLARSPESPAVRDTSRTISAPISVAELTTSRAAAFGTPLLFRSPEVPSAPVANTSTAVNVLQREPAAVSALRPEIPSLPPESAPRLAQRGVDYERIAEWLARRLEIERERMGVRPWA